MSRATVIVCTHDRAARVALTLPAVVTQAAACDAAVVVVDNASTDDTPGVLHGFAAHDHVRIVGEPTLGLSHARNRGLCEARTATVVLLDDDARPRPGWLAALLAPCRAADVCAVAGRVELALDEPAPSWLTPALRSALGASDAGSRPGVVRAHRRGPRGGNLALDRERALRVGGFDPALGVRGRRHRQHAESDLLQRLERDGGHIRWAPDAVVEHHVGIERLTPTAFLASAWNAGRSAAYVDVRSRGVVAALWRLQWRYGRDLLRAAYHPRSPVDGDLLAAECRRREALGYLSTVARLVPPPVPVHDPALRAATLAAN